MTFVVCPNLAIDRVVAVPALVPGATMRGRVLVQQTGGKGANVVRALRALGGDGLLAGFAAGGGGRLIAELAARDGIAVDLVVIDGEARVSTVVLAGGGPATRLFEYGPSVTAANEHALLAAVRRRPPMTPGEWAIVDGAAPPGASPDFYARLCSELDAAGYGVMLDATGEQLAAALSGRPHLVKVNQEEAREALAKGASRSAPPQAPARALRLCERLVEAGAREAVVTLGAAGAVALVGGRGWFVPAPEVEAVNTTGSGDCFAGALLLAFERGEPAEAALAIAAGAAAANAADPVTGRFDAALARRLAPVARPRPLPLHRP